MKTIFFTSAHLAACLVFPLAAQNLASIRSGVPESGRDLSAEVVNVMELREIPVVHKSEGAPSEVPIVYTAQDSTTLDQHPPVSRGADSSVDSGVLEKPSPFRKAEARNQAETSRIQAESLKRDLARFSAVYRESGKRDADCQGVALSVEQRVKADPARVLEIVETEVRANPSCSCEIVKNSIKASEADVALVVSIVETSITAAPEMMRIISQCAIAAMPESLPEVQAVLARYDRNAGDGAPSAKSSKDSKAPVPPPAPDVAAAPNPLDFPGHGPIGPNPGGPGGQPLIPIFPPIIITPPTVTTVDP